MYLHFFVLTTRYIQIIFLLNFVLLKFLNDHLKKKFLEPSLNRVDGVNDA